ncbi:amidohydrolase [bacterium]|nr:amidohydrolase [bacterium]
MPDLKQRLLDEMRTWEIIDCHEHLPPESVRLGQPVDALTLFGHYTHNDLITAGMSRADYDRTQDHAVALRERWELVKPFWERIRFTGYARPILHALQRFYEADDLTDDTVEAVSERMAANNTPGLYERVMREACRIRLCLTQIGRVPEANRDLLVPILPLDSFARVPGLYEMGESASLQGVRTLADYLEVVQANLECAKRQGVVGLKMMSAVLPPEDPAAAEAAWTALRAGKEHDAAALAAFLKHRTLELAADGDLTVAVHCGIIWTNWQDFTTLHPRHMIPTILAHRRTRFDLYHAGIPWLREIGVIAKSYPNVWLNLCWCHIISPQMSMAALSEWLDLVPFSKILGFGGDYGKPVEKVYGHLQLALEDIATVLAGRVEQGWMTETQALQVAHAWLWDNPVELYRLTV